MVSQTELDNLLNHVETMDFHIGQLKQAILAAQKSIPASTESSNSDAKKAYIAMYRTVEYLLKIACFPNGKNVRIFECWKSALESRRGKARDITMWGKRNPDNEIITYLYNKIGDIWADGVDEFKKDMVGQADLLELPEYCPWSLKELMEAEIDNLISSIVKK